MGQCCVACCVECITGQKLEDLKNASNGTVGDTRRDAQGNFVVPDHIHLRVFGDFAQKYADVWHTNTDGAASDPWDFSTLPRTRTQARPVALRLPRPGA